MTNKKANKRKKKKMIINHRKLRKVKNRINQ